MNEIIKWINNEEKISLISIGAWRDVGYNLQKKQWNTYWHSNKQQPRWQHRCDRWTLRRWAFRLVVLLTALSEIIFHILSVNFNYIVVEQKKPCESLGCQGNNASWMWTLGPAIWQYAVPSYTKPCHHTVQRKTWLLKNIICLNGDKTLLLGCACVT